MEIILDIRLETSKMEIALETSKYVNYIGDKTGNIKVCKLYWRQDWKHQSM